jgi:hypothetical protein
MLDSDKLLEGACVGGVFALPLGGGAANVAGIVAAYWVLRKSFIRILFY